MLEEANGECGRDTMIKDGYGFFPRTNKDIEGSNSSTPVRYRRHREAGAVWIDSHLVHLSTVNARQTGLKQDAKVKGTHVVSPSTS